MLVMHRHLLRRRRLLRRLRSLRGCGARIRVLRIYLLLREWLWALAETFVEGRAERAREVRRVVEAGGPVIREVLVAIDVRLLRRRERLLRLAVLLTEVGLIYDGLVAALDEDGYVSHVGGMLRVRRVLRVLRTHVVQGAVVGRR